MSGELWWDDEDAKHIRSRSIRYPGATDVEPDWTLEAALIHTRWCAAQKGGPIMTDPRDARSTRRARHAAILAEVALEEAEAAEAKSAEQAGALDVALHLRIDRELDAQLRSRALAEQIPTSALVRRLLRQAVHEQRSSGLTAAEVEQIARRVARQEVHGTR